MQTIMKSPAFISFGDLMELSQQAANLTLKDFWKMEFYTD